MVIGTVILLVVILQMHKKSSTSGTMSIDIIPDNYSFLLFPKNKDVSIYKENDFSSAYENQTVDRAVTATYDEIQEGVIGMIVDDKNDGFIKFTALQFLPEGNQKVLIEAWKKTLFYQGYTDAAYDITDLGKGIKKVRLELVDDKHARSRIYIYLTDGANITGIKPIETKSGFLWVAMFINFVIGFLILYVISIVVFRDWKLKILKSEKE